MPTKSSIGSSNTECKKRATREFTSMIDKPSILEVVGLYVSLRRSGKEWAGLCPFHAEKTPSFYVNEDKQVFLCRGCGEGGDVFNFIAKIENIPIGDVLRRYHIERKYTPKDPARQRSAQMLAGWLNDHYLKVGILLRELSQDIALAEELRDSELLASLTGQWEILAVFHDDLQNPEFAEELWRARDSIEAITQSAEPEPLPEFPPLTAAYREHIRAAVWGEL